MDTPGDAHHQAGPGTANAMKGDALAFAIDRHQARHSLPLATSPGVVVGLVGGLGAWVFRSRSNALRALRAGDLLHHVAASRPDLPHRSRLGPLF